MRPIRYTISAFIFLILTQAGIHCYGQLGISFNLKKPKEYDDRVLRSEKSDEKKFTLPRRFIQNTVTHYNYFFNANNKLNEVIERAKSSFIDDYSKLLPFYNYSLDVTARDNVQLDSIVYKSETGIALHDLRGDWVDNLYLLWGASYYLHKKFDSAYLMFQFINYAFAPKEKDGYYKTIGSNRDGSNAFSISTKEKTSLPKKVFSEPPSRNDAFIWQIRNFLAQDEFTEAASLIVTLKNDPNFPKRLQNDLEEVQAWWFYKQNMWDSAAPHLVNALSNATSQQERARWEYLAAQLYELSGNYDEAEKYYAKSIIHTTDPVLDVYARLNSIRVNKSGGENYIDKNIADLLKMARREKYDDYRDIIYYMAAQMRLQQNNVDAAYALLQKGARYASGNSRQRNKIFLQLGEMAFSKKLYRAAFNFYDSLNLNDTALHDVAQITKRKDMLGNLAMNIEVIERQDSLQKIASMPEGERKDLVKKLVKQIRKSQGLKDEGTSPVVSPFDQQNNTSLFANSADTKGDWYFYNSNIRNKGYADFISRWGKRPNADNWRRSSSLTGIVATGILKNNLDSSQATGASDKTGETEITFDALYDKLPLTPQKMNVSNDSVSAAMFNLGKIYANEIEDCAATIETFEELRTRFPKFAKMDEVLFHLYYCYKKNGETAKAEQIKKLMSNEFPKSNFTTIAVTGKNPESKEANPDATKAYEKIYDLFIEGNFAEAVAQKKIADSLYGKNYWTPQLLYIESVYYIKQRQDSVAKTILNSIITTFPGTPLADRAKTLIDVLRRRKQIEEELTNLVIKKPDAENNNNALSKITVPQKPISKNLTDSIKNYDKQVVTQPVIKPPFDSTTSKIIQQPVVQQPVATSYTFTPDAPHYVALILTKVDPIFAGEAKNAFFRYNRETYYNKTMATDLIDIDGENKLLLISPFKNSQEAIDYINQARPLTPTEIIPWLKGGKYSFSIITGKNLEVLKTSKDIENYKKFLNQNFPGKF
jgi:outer membrane protein assembly factor BamD (BamD/ComL family)/predicted negative regulator of RcsB-dependent stress response